MKFKNFILLNLLIAIAFIVSCTKDGNFPPNPYDDIDRPTSEAADTLNPRSFAGLHKKIFAVKCAVPGCHDGNFEPDFRSVQSAYSTLVYHPVVKKLSPWKFRVTPKDTAASWFWQRINHSLIISGTDTSEGRMPLYSSKLSASDLSNISYWILNGAKDMFGQNPKLPNSEPTVTGFIALDSTYSIRFDTIREGNLFYNSFIVDTATVVNIAVGVADDSTAVGALTNNKLKLSLAADDFTNAKVLSGMYLGFANGWLFTFNTNLFSPNQTVFMRYYTNDGDHTADTEFPRNDHIYPYKTLWSFKIVPQ